MEKGTQMGIRAGRSSGTWRLIGGDSKVRTGLFSQAPSGKMGGNGLKLYRGELG